MMTTVIGFIPFMTCLFWLVLNPLVQKQDKPFRALEFFLAITAATSLAQAVMSFSTGTVLLTFSLIKQFFTPLLVPAALSYISSLMPGTKWKPSIQAWLAIPIALVFAETVLINADDRTASLLHFCSFQVFYIVLAAQVLIWIILAAARTFKGNRHIQMYNSTAVILAVGALEVSAITGMSSWTGAAINIILACIIFFTSYTGIFRNKATLRASETDKPHAIKEQPQESGTIIADAHQSLADEEKLRIRFEDLIVTEQLFLKQGIRISDIATMLETNRTYISRLVNNTYNMSFSDYMNTLRIDYAEQYLLHHKDAKQSDIAEACGFPNAPAFNNVFKKITGVTPKIWLATRS